MLINVYGFVYLVHLPFPQHRSADFCSLHKVRVCVTLICCMAADRCERHSLVCFEQCSVAIQVEGAYCQGQPAILSGFFLIGGFCQCNTAQPEIAVESTVFWCFPVPEVSSNCNKKVPFKQVALVSCHFSSLARFEVLVFEPHGS